MSRAISAALPPTLYRYTDVALRLDSELGSESNRLAGVLHHFEATCREPGMAVRVSHLADMLGGFARDNQPFDAWVRTVGRGFELADRGYDLQILKGGVMHAQALAVLKNLSSWQAHFQSLSLWFQFKQLDFALNRLIWGLRAQIFRFRVSPFIDVIRLPWDTFEKYKSLVAAGLVVTSVHAGTTYPGQIIIRMPHFLKDLGFSLKEVKTWAGLKGAFTHGKFTILPKHIFWANLALSVPSLLNNYRKDILEYVGGELYQVTLGKCPDRRHCADIRACRCQLCRSVGRSQDRGCDWNDDSARPRHSYWRRGWRNRWRRCRCLGN